VAAWLANAGADVALIGRVGDDALADVALAGLHGVDLRVARAGRTGICVVLVAGDAERTMLPDPGANDELKAADLPADLFAPGNVLYLSGYTLLRPGTRPAAQAALARARETNMAIVLDAASAAPLQQEPEFMEWAGALDLLFANEAEMQVLGGALGVRETVIKRGADGAIWTSPRQTLQVQAEPGDAVDTTGAGDAFAAGFLTAWPDNPQAALDAATQLAALAVARPGGRP
jgi:sugar/nucleoside kinase (ribokinase family)